MRTFTLATESRTPSLETVRFTFTLAPLITAKGSAPAAPTSSAGIGATGTAMVVVVTGTVVVVEVVAGATERVAVVLDGGGTVVVVVTGAVAAGVEAAGTFATGAVTVVTACEVSGNET